MLKFIRNNVAALLLIPSVAFMAQQPVTRSMTLNVSAAPDPGDLSQTDLQLLDNKVPKALISFKRVTQSEEPVHVILAIDAVNIGFTRVAYARAQVQKFLRAREGKLAFPTTFVVVSDKSTEIQKEFSTDGNALSEALGKYDIGLRIVRRDSGFWGADERVGISLNAFRALTEYAATIPGRKLLIWVSPGWPLLSGVRVDLDMKQQQRVFADVVAFSKALQQADLTLYNVNPLGPEEGLLRADFYESFLKGVSKPSQTDIADLSLQVLAVQSGGLATTNSSDVAGNIEKCLADARSWYELTFPLSTAEHANEYHHLDVKATRPGVTLRTRDGYYTQP